MSRCRFKIIVRNAKQKIEWIEENLNYHTMRPILKYDGEMPKPNIHGEPRFASGAPSEYVQNLEQRLEDLDELKSQPEEEAPIEKKNQMKTNMNRSNKHIMDEGDESEDYNKFIPRRKHFKIKEIKPLRPYNKKALSLYIY